MMEINLKNFDAPWMCLENIRTVINIDGRWYYYNNNFGEDKELVDENIWDIEIILRDYEGEPELGVATSCTHLIVELPERGTRETHYPINGISLKEEDFLGLSLETAIEKLKDVNYFIYKVDGVIQDYEKENLKYFTPVYLRYPYLITNRYNLEIENNKVVKIFRG